MEIINEVFGEIKSEIIDFIRKGRSPMDIAHMFAVCYSFSPSTTRLLHKGITQIYSEVS